MAADARFDLTRMLPPGVLLRRPSNDPPGRLASNGSAEVSVLLEGCLIPVCLWRGQAGCGHPGGIPYDMSCIYMRDPLLHIPCTS